MALLLLFWRGINCIFDILVDICMDILYIHGKSYEECVGEGTAGTEELLRILAISGCHSPFKVLPAALEAEVDWADS